MFEGCKLNEKIDQYAFAMLLWESLTGQLPWKCMSNPMQVRPVCEGSQPLTAAGHARSSRNTDALMLSSR